MGLSRLFARNQPTVAEPIATTGGELAESTARPEGCLIWCHAQSVQRVGAVAALAQELARLRGEPVHTLLTSSAAEATPPFLADRILRVPAPSDRATALDEFFDRWKPNALVVLDSIDSVALATAAERRGLPRYLAATHRGAFSDRKSARKLEARVLQMFDACLAPSAADAQSLNVPPDARDHIQTTGPLSDTALALPCNDRDLDEMKSRLGGRPIWLSARITRAEVETMEAAQRRTIRAAHRLLAVVIPRDQEETSDIAKAFTDRGWRVALERDGDVPNDAVQVYITDGDDDLGLWYRLSPISVLGGSFDEAAATTDPYEPAALGSAIVHGPNVTPTTRFEQLREAGAMLSVGAQESLGEAIFGLLLPEKTAQLAHAGWSVTTESAHVVERLATMMNDALDAQEFG